MGLPWLDPSTWAPLYHSLRNRSFSCDFARPALSLLPHVAPAPGLMFFLRLSPSWLEAAVVPVAQKCLSGRHTSARHQVPLLLFPSPATRVSKPPLPQFISFSVIIQNFCGIVLIIMIFSLSYSNYVFYLHFTEIKVRHSYCLSLNSSLTFFQQVLHASANFTPH